MTSHMHITAGSRGKKKAGFEEAANESEVQARMKKQQQFPGLSIADDQQRAHSLLYDKQDVKVASEALSEVSVM